MKHTLFKEPDNIDLRALYIKQGVITEAKEEEELVWAYLAPIKEYEWLPFTSIELLKKRRQTLIDKGLLVPKGMNKTRH